jgi:uncharacterized membrane protein
VPAYDQVKVWEIQPDPQGRPKGARVRPSRPERRPQRFEDAKERAERNEKLFVWGRLFAVASLGVAMLWWPYARSCGFGLAGYLSATLMIVVGGLWVVACTWIQRMARTHALAMLITLWGVTLIAIEVLPRVGYARTDPVSPVAWLCSR